MASNPSLPLRELPTLRQGGPPSSCAAVEPLLIPDKRAAMMCGRSEASWWRDHAAKRIPAPIKLGGRTLWRVQELHDWVAAGCPDRRTWEALRASRKGGRS
jgi:predicted DNA-binding transcriptional regulator AlpA